MVDIPYLSHLEPPYSITWTGAWSAGTTVSINWTSVVTSSPCGSAYAFIDAITDGGDTIPQTAISSGAGGHSFTLAHNATAIHFNVFTDSYCSGGTMFGVTITPDGTPAYCVYGTQVKPTVPAIISLLPAVITAIVGGATDGWAWPLAAAFAGHELDVGALCSTLPPTAPNLTPSDLVDMLAYPPTPTSIAALGKAWTWFKAAAWSYFCQCTLGSSGSPPPLTPPTGIPYSNPGTQPAPVVTCDDGDLCALLTAMQMAINALSQQVSIVNSTVTLIQRQKVPFAYIPGALHTGLVGAGTFAVQGILGLSIQATTIPPYLSSDMAPVQSWFKLGEVSWGTSDGWQPRRIVTHNPHLFLDIDGDVTEVAYQFEPGVHANILELIREA
jgi:hypothetical protein